MQEWLRGTGPLMRLESRCWPGLQSSEVLTEVDRSTSKVVHSHGATVGGKPQFLPHGPLNRLLKCPRNMAAGFPEGAVQEQEGSHSAF